MSTLSGMAYESMTMMGETTTSAWPAATEDHVGGRASSHPLPYSPECVEVEFCEVRGGTLSSVCLSAPCPRPPSPTPGWREVIG